MPKRGTPGYFSALWLLPSPTIDRPISNSFIYIPALASVEVSNSQLNVEIDADDLNNIQIFCTPYAELL